MTGKNVLSKEEPESKKQEPAKKRKMCSAHPDRTAKHTTTSSAHWPISLCAECLKTSPHMAER